MNANTHAAEVLARINSAGVRVAAIGDRLRLIPRSRVTPEIADLARQYKLDLMAYLAAARTVPIVDSGDTALRLLHETLFRIDLISEGYEASTLVKMDRMVREFGRTLATLFLRAEYRSVRFACQEFEECAKALAEPIVSR